MINFKYKGDNLVIHDIFGMSSIILDSESLCYIYLQDILLPDEYAQIECLMSSFTNDLVYGYNDDDYEYIIEILKPIHFYSYRILLRFGNISEPTIRVLLRVTLSMLNKVDCDDTVKLIIGNFLMELTNKLLYLKHCYQNGVMAEQQKYTMSGIKIPLRITTIPLPDINNELPF